MRIQLRDWANWPQRVDMRPGDDVTGVCEYFTEPGIWMLPKYKVLFTYGAEFTIMRPVNFFGSSYQYHIPAETSLAVRWVAGRCETATGVRGALEPYDGTRFIRSDYKMLNLADAAAELQKNGLPGCDTVESAVADLAAIYGRPPEPIDFTDPDLMVPLWRIRVNTMEHAQAC